MLDIWFLPVSILDFVIVCFMIAHLIMTWSDKNKDYFKKVNEIVYCIITFAFGLYYPLFIVKFGDNLSGIIFEQARMDFIFLGNIFIVGVIFLIALWALSAKIKTIMHPELLETQNNYDLYVKEFLEEYSKKNILRRKYFHTIPFGVVGIVIILFYFFSSILGEIWFNYARFFIVIIGADFAFTFICGDLVRLLDFSYMPSLVAVLFKKAMTDDEIDTFTSTSVIVFGFGAFLLFDFSIFIIVLLIAAVADAFASICGLTAKNKIFFPKGCNKTVQGYIGGAIFAFFCTLFGIYFSSLFGLTVWSLEITIFIAFILSLLFLVIDIITSKVKLQDNYLNPIIIGTVLIVLLWLLDMPIF